MTPGASSVRTAAAALAVTLLCARVAPAQTSDDNDRRARVEFTAGRDAFTHGDFREAAMRFETAYHLSHRAQLLYNLGTAYDRLHRWTDARDAFQQYLDAFPSAPEHDEIHGRLQVIDDEIRRQEQQEQDAAASPEPTASTSASSVRTEAPPQVIVRTVPAESHTLRWIGLGALLLGTVSGAASALIGVLTTSLYQGLVDSCGMTASGCAQPEIDDIALRASLVNFFGIAAGVLAVGGTALIIYDATSSRPSESHARMRFVPMLSVMPGGGPSLGLSIAGWL